MCCVRDGSGILFLICARLKNERKLKKDLAYRPTEGNAQNMVVMNHFYLSFSVTIARMASMMPTIQKRVTILLS